jgi:lipoprotein-anchoring transpeptidase ErfK/SrfK
MHGTDHPLDVVRRVSHGCLRLHDEDATTPFRRGAVSTPVAILGQPVEQG